MNIKNTSAIMAHIKGGHCEILGFGVSGKPLLPWLMAHGASSVTVRDQRTQEDMQASGDADLIASEGATLVCGENYLQNLGKHPQTTIFRSPGIRPDVPEILEAVEEGAVLTSEMELFLTLTPARVFAVTGSDGKTTTTTLVSEMLKGQTAKIGSGRVYLGGNIGTPLLPFVDEMTEQDFAVVELSSFQLMTMPKEANIHTAIITNITRNHLNWHIDYDEYIAAKANIGKSHVLTRLVLNEGNDLTCEIGNSMDDDVVSWFSAKSESDLPVRHDGCRMYLEAGQIYLNQGGESRVWMPVSCIRLLGVHNVENYMAAMSAVMGMVDVDVMTHVAETFSGVPHRLQLIREVGGVKFYNSSIDSTPTRTCAALSALRELRERQGRDENGCLYGKDPIVICGGRDKHVSFAPLATGLCQMASAVVLTGEARGLILKEIEACPLYDKEKLPVIVIPDYMTAMRETCRMAKAGDIVLLSPACTSFDAFKNFAERGNAFASIVEEL